MKHGMVINPQCSFSEFLASCVSLKYNMLKEISLIPYVKGYKLDKKEVPGIFVGYNVFSLAYMVYEPKNEKNFVRRDVDFFED